MKRYLRLGVGPVGDIQTVALAGSGGGGASNYSATTIVTSGSQATIAFNSISASFAHARITIMGRDTSTSIGDGGVRIKLNGDGTAGNYTATCFLQGNGTTPLSSTVASSSAGVQIANLPGTLNQANAVGCAVINIPNYKSTAFTKILRATVGELHSAGPTILVLEYTVAWNSTAAINAIVLTAGGTAFLDGTTATLELFG